MMTQEWVKENNAQKVIYLDDTGPIREAMTALFNNGYLDLQARIKHPDDGMWNMSYTNKNMSSFRARTYGLTCCNYTSILNPSKMHINKSGV